MILRAFINAFQPAISPSLGGFFEAGGHPQTPGKGPSALCTPQLPNDLMLDAFSLLKGNDKSLTISGQDVLLMERPAKRAKSSGARYGDSSNGMFVRYGESAFRGSLVDGL